MKAKVVKAFAGVADGQHYPKAWQPGDVIEGDLAAVAVREKWAEPVKASSAAASAPSAETVSGQSSK